MFQKFGEFVIFFKGDCNICFVLLFLLDLTLGG